LQTLPSLVQQAKLLVSSNQLYSTREGNIIFRRAGIFGVAVAALLALPSIASAHTVKPMLGCTNHGVLLEGYANKPGNVVNWAQTVDGVRVDGSWTFDGTSTWRPLPPLPSDGLNHSYSLNVWWSTNNHTGGSQTVNIGSTSFTCGSLAPPPVQPPATPNPPAPRKCYSRRDFRVRVSRKHNGEFKSGFVVTDAGRTFNLHLRKSGRLSTRINWRDVPGTKHQLRYFAFFLQRNDGSWTSGKRRARLCTPRKQANPPTLNLKIGVRVPYALGSKL
jgi:hypothetical protein